MNFQESLNFRHACKIFDESKSINDADFQTILNAGRLSPSSFGLEHWQIEVIRNPELKAAMRLACWNQVQITSCSELLVIYARIADMLPNSDYIHKAFSRKTHHSEAETKAYIAKYAEFFKRFADERDIFGWSKAQCFLCVQNMMTQAALLGIDSCCIEGFVESDLNKVLGVDATKRRVAVVLPLGYRINAAPEKIRQSLEEIVSYR